MPSFPRAFARFAPLLFAAFAALPAAGAEPAAPGVTVAQSRYDFGVVARGSRVSRSFVALRNGGARAVRITAIEFPLAGMKLSAPSDLPPGGEAELLLELETAALVGDVEAEVAIHTDDPAAPVLRLVIAGRVDSAVEITPRPAIFLSVFRWQIPDKEGGVLLAGREGQPLGPIDVATDSDQFVATVTAQPDGRQRVAIRMRPEAAAGRRLGSVTVRVGSETIELPAYTFVKERVYLNPDELELGRIDRAELAADPGLRQFLNRSLFVYRVGAEPFEIRVEAPASLIVSLTPPEGVGSVVDVPRQGATGIFEIVVSPNFERLVAGELRERLRITTNDPDFPVLEIPVSAEID